MWNKKISKTQRSNKNLRDHICWVHSIFRSSIFGQSDQKSKKSAVIFRQNADFFKTENKQTGQLSFSFLVSLTKKTKDEKWKMKWTGQKLSNLIQRRSQVLRSNTLDFHQAWFWLKRTKNMAWWTSYHQHHFWSLSLLSITYNKVHIINAFPIELWWYFSSYALYLKAW